MLKELIDKLKDQYKDHNSVQIYLDGISLDTQEVAACVALASDRLLSIVLDAKTGQFEVTNVAEKGNTSSYVAVSVEDVLEYIGDQLFEKYGNLIKELDQLHDWF